MAGRRSTVIQGTAVAVIVASMVAGAVVAQGFDVAQTPVNDSGVWALQQGDGDRYARVNTELHELDTIKDVENPSGLVQSESIALLLMERNGRVATIDPARPGDFDAESTDITNTPTATATVVTSDNYVAYLSDGGRISTARIDDGASATTVTVDPYADENSQPGAERRVFAADAIAITSRDVLYAFSSAAAAVLRFDLRTGTVLGFDDVPDAPDEEGPQLTAVGTTWVLLAGDGGSLWVNGGEPVSTGLVDDAVIQRPSAAGQSVFVANRGGLSEFSLADGSSTRPVERGATIGVPAAPRELAGVMYAAWLGETSDSGLLWSSADGETVLDYAGQPLSAEPVPVLRSNNARMILNDTESGWVWTVPDGVLVASSQDWGLAAASDNESEDDEEQAPVISESKPPVAEDDQFGVRAGQLVSLPVLLNDHDPNEDVLTIDPASIQGLDSSFGTVSVTNNSQDLAVRVDPAASGTVTFHYAANDGSQHDGLLSQPATVTLTVFGPEVNSAPVWCGVAGCVREWPTLQVQPGRSASVEVLRGWVDPEGDPVYVASALVLDDRGSVASTPDGRVLFQHPDSAVSGGRSEVSVRVADTLGAGAEKVLAVEITATPSLSIEPFALVVSAGEPVRVDPSPYITGVSGSYAIQSAATELEDDGTEIAVDNGATTFNFAAPATGSYVVSYTVQDDQTEVIGVVRVMVVEDDDLPLSTSPITVFVRPKADVTVDVFSAVSNPANKVLLLSEALPRPLSGAILDVEIVNQHLLRVKGSTSDGLAGVIGSVRYTVSDGTGNARTTAHGEATVILLPSVGARPPIAIPDSVTVRSGEQVDIPVLANDLAADGNTLLLNSDELRYTSEEGLAFVSGSVVRLLAPATPGLYELGYTVYSAGSPDVSAQASVRITVLPPGENHAPEPRPLVGRVLAGSSVVIPFDDFGVDPDGDSVVLDRVLTQPVSGVATIAPTGDGIVYTSVPGYARPVSFDYQVSDVYGKSGTATVRVGVLDQESDPSPVTYSDYVEVQVGRDNHITLHPAANDIDPAGKLLEVTDVLPDAPAGTQEYADLAALIRLDDDGTVRLTAGTVLGSHTFFYTVANTTGDTSTGLIVMKVVRESVPDRPVVRDSYLTVEQRAAFSSGIDVVSGKVTWNSGDIDDLRLSLLAGFGAYRVDGWKIAGDLPSETAVIPFQLSGTNALGEEVSTFGFLRIPGRSELIISLRSGARAQEVDENKSVEFDLADLAAVPVGERLILDEEGVETAGSRVEARCSVTRGTTISYVAGEGEPWVDYCAIPARISGQSSYTVLVVPITVIPEIPLPILHSAALTHSPAAAPLTYDLRSMVDWAGKEDDESLAFSIQYAPDQFVVTQSDSLLAIRAIDSANPGRENTVKVSLSSHPGVASAALSLKVGPAPTELAKGGTVVSQGCTQADNATSCVIRVIGVPGEVNPLPGTPLVLASVGSTATCSGVTMEVADASTVRASWLADAPGGKCSASFVVRDAQGRLSPDDRNGTVLLDLAGFPKAPSSLVQSGYGDGVVRLAVTPGPASAAYPPITGFTVVRGGTVVSTCTASGVCDDITGVANGDKLTYEARAVNAVGQSKAGVTRLAWGYLPPVVDNVTRDPVYRASTSETEGWVTVSIDTTDPTAQSFVVTGAPSPVTRTGATTVVEVQRPVGTQSVSVTPVSQYEVPTGIGPTAGVTTGTVEVAGQPVFTAPITVSTVDDDELSVDGVAIDSNHSALPLDVVYIAYPASGSPAECTADSNGDLVTSGPGMESASPVIGGLLVNTLYNVIVCASNGFGVGVTEVATGVPWLVPAAPSGHTYTVGDGSADGDFIITPSGSAPPLFEARYLNYTGTAATLYGQDPGITVHYCLIGFDDNFCGPEAPVAPADPDRVYQIDLGSVTPPTCTIGAALSPGVSGEFGPTPAIVTVTAFDYYDTGGSPVSVLGDDAPVPVGAAALTGYTVRITWTASGTGAIYTYTHSFALSVPEHITCN